MAKNIIVCLDGTSNQFCTHNTNIVRLFQVLDHNQQATYYHPGLGTMEAVGALTSVGRKATKLLGLALGFGLETDIARAYCFIRQQYEPNDKIFLFGFSRGAYTARALAALIHMYGLVRPGNEGLVPYALRMQNALNRGAKTDEVFGLADGFKRTFSSSNIGIHFLGLWDTVSSVGWIANPLRLPHTAHNPSVSIIRHAVSIDERRAFFRQNLWSRNQPGDLKEVWFPGDHCDVGGGHEGSDEAAKVALRWMIAEAQIAGLLIETGDQSTLGSPSSPSQETTFTLHDSLTGWWRLAEFFPKRHFDAVSGRVSLRANLFRRRTLPEECLVHSSAWDRDDAYRARLPSTARRI